MRRTSWMSRSYDVEAGLIFEFPLSNRAAKARHSRAVISKQQSIKALENLIQLAQVDVRTAYVEVDRTHEQITATAATREFQEEKLRVETEKFRVGKSTSLLVAQAQRDLVVSQIGEILAIANYFKSLWSRSTDWKARCCTAGASRPRAPNPSRSTTVCSAWNGHGPSRSSYSRERCFWMVSAVMSGTPWRAARPGF